MTATVADNLESKNGLVMCMLGGKLLIFSNRAMGYELYAITAEHKLLAVCHPVMPGVLELKTRYSAHRRARDCHRQLSPHSRCAAAL
jgi:hypothetical protein